MWPELMGNGRSPSSVTMQHQVFLAGPGPTLLATTLQLMLAVGTHVAAQHHPMMHEMHEMWGWHSEEAVLPPHDETVIYYGQ